MTTLSRISGLDNAGKTTILKRFNGEAIDTISPTLGFNIKTLDHRDYKLNMWDVGGQKSLRFVNFNKQNFFTNLIQYTLVDHIGEIILNAQMVLYGWLIVLIKDVWNLVEKSYIFY